MCKTEHDYHNLNKVYHNTIIAYGSSQNLFAIFVSILCLLLTYGYIFISHYPARRDIAWQCFNATYELCNADSFFSDIVWVISTLKILLYSAENAGPPAYTLHVFLSFSWLSYHLAYKHMCFYLIIEDVVLPVNVLLPPTTTTNTLPPTLNLLQDNTLYHLPALYYGTNIVANTRFTNNIGLKSAILQLILFCDNYLQLGTGLIYCMRRW